MSTNPAPKTTTIATGPSNTSIVHTNPGTVPNDPLSTVAASAVKSSTGAISVQGAVQTSISDLKPRISNPA